jgi:hypothetical protein
MKVILKECHLIDLDEVQYAELRKKTCILIDRVYSDYSIRLVFINGKEEEINYGGDEAQATNDLKLIVELSAKGDKNV